MPLNGNSLGAAMKAASDAFQDQAPPADAAEMEARVTAYWNALGGAVVNYLIANAAVSVTVATTGSATAQTGTGTGTIS